MLANTVSKTPLKPTFNLATTTSRTGDDYDDDDGFSDDDDRKC